MFRPAWSRKGLLVGVAFLGALSVGATSVSAAGQKPILAPQKSAGHAVHNATNASGTYEWFVAGTDEGQIVLNSNGTWASSSHCDNGSWLVQKATIAVSDLLCGSDPNGETFLATVGKHGLSSLKKPGTFLWPNASYSGHWYAVKL